MNSDLQKHRVSYRKLLQVALPLIITSASFTMLHFCDRMFLSWYSPVSIQAVVPAGILSFTLISFFMALCAMANSFVAQYYGAGEHENCSRSVAQALFMALLSLPLIWMLIPAGIQLLAWSGHTPEVFAQEKTYLSILMLGGVNVPLTAAAGSFYSGRGKTRVIMVAHLIGNSTNVLLNWFLIFGHGPFPAMGIKGAAIASLIAGFVAPSILLGLYFSPANALVYRTREMLRFNRPLFLRMLRFGLPSGVHLVLDVGSFSLFVLLLGRLGDTAFLASNIVLSINMIAFMPAIGIGQAASVLVGQCMGRADVEEAEASAWKAARVGWIYTLIVVSSFLAFPELYIHVFARGDVLFSEVFNTARLLLFFAAAWGLMEATNAVLSSALRGAGDTHFVMWFHTAVAWGFFALGEVLIVLVFHLGVLMAWGWAIAYFSLLAAGWILRIRSGRWKFIQLIERAPTEVEQSAGIPV
ncbi:MAG: MATE family efflux transporter [Kiritimatiellales bacterium]|nr:MATE family efflux transporter [Kiritimatiellales bacterium]